MGPGRRHGAGDHRQFGPDQRRCHGDRQVDLVVAGQGQHAGAVRLVQPGDGQVVRIAHIAGQTGDVGVVGDQVERVDAVRGLIDDDEPTSAGCR